MATPDHLSTHSSPSYHYSGDLSSARPIEGLRQRLAREAREALDLLAPYHATLSGDLLRAYDAVLAWKRTPTPQRTPEPEATRIRTAAAMLKAGTLSLSRS